MSVAKVRKEKVRKKLKAVSDRMRLTVFRSNKHIWAQVIDDSKSKTVVSSSDKALKLKGKTKTEAATLVGEDIAKKAIKAKIDMVYFDRGSYKYHGRVRALAEGARKAGLKF